MRSVRLLQKNTRRGSRYVGSVGLLQYQLSFIDHKFCTEFPAARAAVGKTRARTPGPVRCGAWYGFIPIPVTGPSSWHVDVPSCRGPLWSRQVSRHGQRGLRLLVHHSHSRTCEFVRRTCLRTYSTPARQCEINRSRRRHRRHRRVRVRRRRHLPWALLRRRPGHWPSQLRSGPVPRWAPAPVPAPVPV